MPEICEKIVNYNFQTQTYTKSVIILFMVNKLWLAKYCIKEIKYDKVFDRAKTKRRDINSFSYLTKKEKYRNPKCEYFKGIRIDQRNDLLKMDF